jgi:hypothetical protein
MTPKPIVQNTLFYGDTLPILREYVPGESIDLVYLDPPSNSAGWNQDYPRIQLLTVGALLQGAQVQMPLEWGTFRQAERVQGAGAVQGKLAM